MPTYQYPKFFQDRTFSNEEALKLCVKSGTTLASGFATSEPHTLYEALWDHIQREDIVDLEIKQALFMAPYHLCVGDALQSKGVLKDFAKKFSTSSIFGNLAAKVNAITKQMEGLGKLIDHYKELKERRIVFTSAFIGAATNIIIPSNRYTRLRYSEFVNRNTTRMGITRMHSIHFPDAVDSMGYDPSGKVLIDTFAAVVTPPQCQRGDESRSGQWGQQRNRR